MATPDVAAAVAEDVSQTFENRVVALDHAGVTLERGTITAFIGRNGSGKTTLLRILAGILPAQSGTVRILDEAAHFTSSRLRARLAYISQSAELDPEMTVAETLALFAALYAVCDKNASVDRAMEIFGLAEHRSRRIAALSGGLRQRLHLALGLLHDPELLLLDEPTSALDPEGRNFVWGLLRQRRAVGKTMAVITHDLADAASHCDQVLALDRGCVIAAGSPGELIAAHAGWVMRCEISHNDPQALMAELRLVSGVASGSIQNGEVRLKLTATDAAEAQAIADRVLKDCRGRGAIVTSLRLAAPDLAGAFFELTGNELEPVNAPEIQRTTERSSE